MYANALNNHFRTIVRKQSHCVRRYWGVNRNYHSMWCQKFSKQGVYPYPLGAGSARPNPKMGAPDPENPLFLVLSVFRGGLRPWSRKGPDHGVGVDPETVKSCAAEPALQHSLFCSADVVFTKSRSALQQTKNCTATLKNGRRWKMGHTPSTARTSRKKFRNNSGKTPETLSEHFLEFPSRVRLECPKPYNSRHLRLPEHLPNSLPPSTAGDASFFRIGSGEGLSELVMEFPAVLRAFLKKTALQESGAFLPLSWLPRLGTHAEDLLILK